MRITRHVLLIAAISTMLFVGPIASADDGKGPNLLDAVVEYVTGLFDFESREASADDGDEIGGYVVPIG